MPRKTRKEKFAAQIHKQRKDNEITMTIPSREDVVVHTKEKTLPSKKNIFPSIDNTKGYFLQDLRKSLMVVSLILVIEFALYILGMSAMLTNVTF